MISVDRYAMISVGVDVQIVYWPPFLDHAVSDGSMQKRTTLLSWLSPSQGWHPSKTYEESQS
jgi:hypothetical protein